MTSEQVSSFIELFRSHDLSGWAKTLWFIFILLLPLIGVLVYLIARGGKMHEHQVQDAQVQERELRQYVQQAAGSQSPADQLAKLADLHNPGRHHGRGVRPREGQDPRLSGTARHLTLTLKRPRCPAAIQQAGQAAGAEPVDREHLARVRLAGQRVVVEFRPRGGDEQRVAAPPAECA